MSTLVRAINIKTIEQKQSSKGKPFWKISTDDGEYMQIWKPDVYERVKDGGSHSVSIESNTQGDKTFYNIIGIAPDNIDGTDFLSEMATPAPVAKPTAKSGIPTPPPDNGIAARIAGIDASARLVAGDKLDPKNLMTMAAKIADWIIEGPITIEHKVSTPSDGLDPDAFLAEG